MVDPFRADLTKLSSGSPREVIVEDPCLLAKPHKLGLSP
jgi:hypothetical protein